jgi:hypothetical protein
MNKKLISIMIAVAAISVLVTVLVYPYATRVFEYGSVNVSFTVGSIHATITMEQNGVKVFEQYHAGAITKLGANLTLAKLTGYFTSAYNGTTYNLNLTEISIGNKGTLDADSIVLPGEWNRTAATIHDCTYNSFNLTAVIHPDTGPYTADCLGLNYEDGIANNALWGYDTFAEVTSIDNTFTITIELKVTVA